jgi:TPR repeat protein
MPAVHYFKLSPDEGSADGQWQYGECLRDGKDISKDLISTAQYFKLSADQGSAYGQCCYGRYLEMGQIFPKIRCQQGIISNFHPMKEVLMANAVMADIFEKRQIFQKIWSQ